MNRHDDQHSTADPSYAASGGSLLTGPGSDARLRERGAEPAATEHPGGYPAGYPAGHPGSGGWPTQPLHSGHGHQQHDPWTVPGGPTPPGGGGGEGPGGGGGGGRGRRPGWLGVTGVAVACAVAASALTAGLLGAFGQEEGTTARTSASSSSAQVQGVSETTVNWQAVASAVSPSVVAVAVTSSTASGEGSGIVYDTSGRVVTNNHVVSGAGSNAQITVTLSDGRQYGATVVGTDPATDLAVLQLQDPPADLRAATFADSDQVVAGQAVMALGNPLGLAGSATTGIVSAVDRPVLTTAEDESQQQSPFGSPYGQQTTAETVATNAIQTDAAINPGNSGGALLDSSGRVIGVNSSIASLSSTSSSAQSGSIGLGFAIPSNEVKMIADQLVADGTAEHAWLGVSLAQQDATVTADGVTRTGAEVAAVTDGAPAAQAGVRAGDVITSVDGQFTAGYESLTATIREKAVGSAVTLTVVRDGREEELRATLTARPES